MAKSGTFAVSVTWTGGQAEIRWSTTTNSSANQSTVKVELWAKTSGFTTFGNGSWVLKIGGSTSTRTRSGISVSGSWQKMVDWSRTVTHNTDGSLDINIGVNSGGISGTSWSATSGTKTVALDDFVRVPNWTGGRSITNITPTSATLNWGEPNPSNGTILEYQWRVRAPGESTGTLLDEGYTNGSTRTVNVTGLPPGTAMGFIVRARNSDGWGPWPTDVGYGYATFTTLPSDPPSISVVASPTGTSSTVSLTPPGGISGVDSYTIEYRVKGSSSATSVTTTSSTRVITGLTPGTTYEYRSRATIGSYQSPWTGWVELKQPAPSTEPGAYFDGSTSATDDQTYGWTGTVNNSTSEATGQSATGWRDFATAATDSGGTGVIARVSDPFGSVGSYAARATFLTDATAAGFRAGPIATSNAGDVTPLTDYTASVYVKPSRTQRLAIQIRWRDSGLSELSVSQGTAQVVNSGAYTRLVMTAQSPAGAEFANIEVVDVAGTGWSLWLSGDSITADAAMLSIGSQVYAYFDGDFPAGNGYSYTWTGTANASSSIRASEQVAASDPLRDPDCAPLPQPPRPPVISDTCIDDIALWRRYTVVIPAEYTYDWQDVVPTFRLTTAQDYPGVPGDTRQVRIRVYPNPFGYSPANVDVSTWCAEMIVSYIPSDTVLTIDGEIQRTFAEVKGAAAIPADHLVYGTGGVPPTWPVLECGVAYMVTFDTPLEGLTPIEDLKPEILLTRKF